jgi:hypothetical protein
MTTTTLRRRTSGHMQMCWNLFATGDRACICAAASG